MIHLKIPALQAFSGCSLDNLQYNSQQSQQACGEYGIPYAQGTIGIIHRSSISTTTIDSWHNLLSPAKEHVGTTMMPDDHQAVACLNQLKSLGVRIALDDFGSGYTSFGQIVNYPLDRLKIDRSFVTHTKRIN